MLYGSFSRKLPQRERACFVDPSGEASPFDCPLACFSGMEQVLACVVFSIFLCGVESGAASRFCLHASLEGRPNRRPFFVFFSSN